MKSYFLTSLAALTLLAACKPAANDAANAPAATPPPAPIATVNGTAVSADLFDTFVKAAAGGRAVTDLTAEQRTEAVDQLVRLVLVQQEAEKQGLTKEKETAALIELSRMDIAQRALTRTYLKGKDPTEQELRAEYEVVVAAAPRTEYRVRHILVQSEEFASALLGRLAKGARFEQLAASESGDQQSKSRGGDLGWAPANRFGGAIAPTFGQAVLSLKKGEYTKTPVQTQYGWHIIKVDDTREAQMPAFDAVKNDLTQLVLGKKFKTYTDELLKVAKVEKKS
jgi:peptidyl-prolyl cis-trans isomerase C